MPKRSRVGDVTRASVSTPALGQTEETFSTNWTVTDIPEDKPIGQSGELLPEGYKSMLLYLLCWSCQHCLLLQLVGAHVTGLPLRPLNPPLVRLYGGVTAVLALWDVI